MSLKLPIDEHLSDILAKLQQEQNIVLVAEPGAGKTTRLPPALLKLGQGKIIVLEPRRVAAVAAADRVAEENNWRLGEEVGYQVRFDNKTTNETRLIYMTEALLARHLLSDPELKNVEAVVLDEFHERSAHVDLALGLLRELQELGSPIKIIVMSATLDAEKISEYLGGCAIIRVPGTLHPLQIIQLEKNLRPQMDYQYIEALKNKIENVAPSSAGDILVFLPGVGEIERTKDALLTWAQKEKIELLTLHGSLNLEDQRRALRPAKSKRIILSTNVAESSLTLDGVSCVIDSGLAKVMKQDLGTGFSRLELSRISQSSAIQRAGRAARQAPGTCYQMWTKFDEASMNKTDTSEILRIDLSESLLFLAAQGSDYKNFMWFETPQNTQMEKAARELKQLGALDSLGKITKHGKRLADLPIAPRWGHFLVLAWQNSHLELAAMATALMQERDILKREESSSHNHYENDLLYRIEVLKDFERGQRPHFIKSFTANSVLQSAAQLKNLFKTYEKQSVNVNSDLGGKKISGLLNNKNEKLNFDQVLLLSFKHQLCRRRGTTDKAKMLGGRGIQISKESSVKTSEFFIALQAIETPGSADSRVTLACGIDKDLVMQSFKNEIIVESDLYFDETKGQLFARKQRKLEDLELEDPRLSPASAHQSESQLAQFMSQNLDFVKRKNEAFSTWLERWAIFSKNLNAESQLTSDHKLKAFEMACTGARRVDEVLEKNLTQYLEMQFAPNLIADFKKEMPEYFLAPTGSKLKIQYPSDRPPFVEVRLQEIFGVQKNPSLLKGELLLQFHLLGPNYRPVQVTSDLASFWQNTYPEVRKELRSRYPKHSWPENPLIAEPVRKGRAVKHNS